MLNHPSAFIAYNFTYLLIFFLNDQEWFFSFLGEGCGGKILIKKKKEKWKQRWQHEEGGGGGDWAGHTGEAVDYESHQVINDFINKTDHAAVIAVTRAEG